MFLSYTLLSDYLIFYDFKVQNYTKMTKHANILLRFCFFGKNTLPLRAETVKHISYEEINSIYRHRCFFNSIDGSDCETTRGA
jgi:hypothetical protein